MPRPDRGVARALAAYLACAGLLAAVAYALPSSLAARRTQWPAAIQRTLQWNDAAWTAMTPAERQALQSRMAQWDALPVAVRRDRRERWQAWRALPPEEQRRVLAAARAVAALPAAEQQALRAGFAALDASERHDWLLGPALGAGMVALHPLLLQVPAVERAPLLATLRAMSPAEREGLGMLAQRTAPQDRDALRRALLSTSQTNRASWLQSQLDR